MPAKLKLLPGGLGRKGPQLQPQAPSLDQLEQEIHAQLRQSVEVAKTSNETFTVLEKCLWTQMLLLGRLLVTLFLACREQRLREKLPERQIQQGRQLTRGDAQSRSLNTLFGVVRYFRTYMRAESGPGMYPLDAQLGLTRDRMSMGLVSVATRMATKMSFAQVHGMLSWFLGQAPSTEVIENSVLGLGRRTGEWFVYAPVPKGDGEVLVVQVDGKGAPTATQTELERRRGPRKKRPVALSPRHRGRQARKQWGPKPRRKKGDKSKNARVATLVVMYTLRRMFHEGKTYLLGPINRWEYASFAPKRHAFAIARREADKRGFTKDSGQMVQVLTDGDEDLALYAKEYFPEAIHTVDVIHVIEYVYKAGECLYDEGSAELKEWVQEQKTCLYGGQEGAVVAEMKRRLLGVPTRGPGNKGRRARLTQAIRYLEKRLPQMRYKWLMEQDLEVGTGIVEGAVKNTIGVRFDHGGSRWIRERAEALLQLRCIERNGDWDAFTEWIHKEHLKALRKGDRIRIQQRQPSALPTVEEVA
jgi:hypothetical protein